MTGIALIIYYFTLLYCLFLFNRFLSKCGDFFDYFISSHLKRIEFNSSFPVVEFFVLFYKYTFKQPETDSYCVCLITWGVFLDHLLLSHEIKKSSVPAERLEMMKPTCIMHVDVEHVTQK